MMTKAVRLAELMAGMDKQLAGGGIQTSRLDARLLVQSVLNITHAGVIANPDMEISPRQVELINQYLERRLKHEPVSRILALREFYGRDFYISPDVLDPRPDTETLIDTVLKYADRGGPLRILDIGTGSGAIILTLLSEMPEATGVASDISHKAIAVAEKNAATLNLSERVKFKQTSWVQGIKGQFDIIVSNPPYIVSSDINELDRQVKDFDPLVALDGGNDGLDAYRQIIRELSGLISENGMVCFETGKGQTDDVVQLLRESVLFGKDDSTMVIDDLAGNDRVVLMIKAVN